MAAQLCEDTKNHRISHFKRVNFMVRKLYLNKAAILKSKNRNKISLLLREGSVPVVDPLVEAMDAMLAWCHSQQSRPKRAVCSDSEYNLASYLGFPHRNKLISGSEHFTPLSFIRLTDILSLLFAVRCSMYAAQNDQQDRSPSPPFTALSPHSLRLGVGCEEREKVNK